MNTLLVTLLVVGVAVGVFEFVKNNRRKAAAIDQVAKDLAAKAQTAVAKEIKKL
jgi:hypothetical protein